MKETSAQNTKETNIKAIGGLKCKSIPDLKRFVNRYAGNDKYATGFRTSLAKETNFDKALIKVWNFALQKEGKYFLGKVGIARVKTGAIAGMECHSEGHR